MLCLKIWQQAGAKLWLQGVGEVKVAMQHMCLGQQKPTPSNVGVEAQGKLL